MIEKFVGYSNSASEIMRTVSSNYDDNLTLPKSGEIIYTSQGLRLSTWERKAKLLNGVLVAFGPSSLSSSDILEYENMQLRNENIELRDEIRRIEERLVNIETSLPKNNVIILRELTRDQAKNEIKKLFSRGKTLYYSDISQQLGLDLELVVDICNELQKSGEIIIDV